MKLNTKYSADHHDESSTWSSYLKINKHESYWLPEISYMFAIWWLMWKKIRKKKIICLTIDSLLSHWTLNIGYWIKNCYQIEGQSDKMECTDHTDAYNINWSLYSWDFAMHLSCIAMFLQFKIIDSISGFYE